MTEREWSQDWVIAFTTMWRIALLSLVIALALASFMSFLMNQYRGLNVLEGKSLFGFLSLCLAALNFVQSFVLLRIVPGANASTTRTKMLHHLLQHELSALVGWIAILVSHSYVLGGLAMVIGLLGVALSFPRRAKLEAFVAGERFST